MGNKWVGDDDEGTQKKQITQMDVSKYTVYIFGADWWQGSISLDRLRSCPTSGWGGTLRG